jgi:hypothetical protein
MKIMATIVFTGDLDPDPDGAAAALRRAGYQVRRMPEKFRPTLAHPRDDFIEALIDIDIDSDGDKIIDAIWKEIDSIVDNDQYAAMCIQCGFVAANYIPFSDVFPDGFEKMDKI